MSNPKHLSLIAILLLLINLTTNPVNSEMRKSWSRKTTSNETEETDSLSSHDIMKYFQANAENSDFESVFSDQTETKDEVTETNDKVMESETTTEVSSDDLNDEEKENEEVTETFNEDGGVVNDQSLDKNDREGNDENSNDRANITQAERDIIRQGLNLIVLGECLSTFKI